MIVYGDAVSRLDPAAELRRIRAELAGLAAAPAGAARHARLTDAFVDAAALVQGLVDAEFADTGEDARTPLHAAAMTWLTDLARRVDASWRAGFEGDAPCAPASAEALAALPFPPEVEVRLAEGYAFYALQPEGHAEAARAAGLDAQSRVLGLRSIGAGLAAMAAAAVGAPVPVTVRPVGHPFDRRLAVAPPLLAEWRREAGRTWAVADEGPGLSGSSLAAALDALEAAGVDRARLVALPGHAGDLGPQAGEVRRARWAATRRVAGGDRPELDPHDAVRGLARRLEDVVGPALGPLEDLSGGAWRARLYAEEAHWPAVDAGAERLKFRLETARGAFRLKWAGLGGREGAAKLARARALHAAGLSPEPLALRGGWLVEPWLEGARPLADTPADRGRAAAAVGAHLAFRARAFPAGEGDGADLRTLLAMARANAAEALGEEAARPLDAWEPRLAALAARGRRVWTDNRLHLHEWMLPPDGGLLKTDALDHARAHDLIGAQDVAWDVAGAQVELALDAAAAARLARDLVVDGERLAFHTLAYLAFQLGLWSMAADAHAGWPAEHARLLRARARYAGALAAALEVNA